MENENKNKRKINQRQKSRAIFYTCIVVLPLIQFAIFYVYKNFKTIMMAFETYSYAQGGGYDVSFAGFSNFAVAFEKLGESLFMIRNSLLLFAVNGVVGLIVAMLFSFYVAKGYFGSKFFNFLLFLPNILSSIVIGILFKYIVNDVYMEIFNSDYGLMSSLAGNTTVMTTIIFYNVWVGFGVHTLMFTGAISGINESVVESAQIDGVNLLQEFWYITVPMIFPTFISFIIINISGIFTNQMNLVTFFGLSGDQYSTLGYYLFKQSKQDFMVPLNSNYISYSQLSALGLILTVIVLVTTLSVKKLLTKFGPSVD